MVLKKSNTHNLIKSLDGLKNHLVKQIAIIDKTIEEAKKPLNIYGCPQCGSADVRHLQSGTFYCRICGFRSEDQQKLKRKDKPSEA